MKRTASRRSERRAKSWLYMPIMLGVAYSLMPSILLRACHGRAVFYRLRAEQ